MAVLQTPNASWMGRFRLSCGCSVVASIPSTYEQYSVSTEVTIQYGFARGKMLVWRKGASLHCHRPRHVCHAALVPSQNLLAAAITYVDLLPRRLATLFKNVHLLSQSSPCAPCHPTTLQQYSSSCCFQPPSFCRERACGLPCFASRKTYRQISCATSHSHFSLRRSANRRSPCHSLCRATSDPTFRRSPTSISVSRYMSSPPQSNLLPSPCTSVRRMNYGWMYA